MSDITDLRLLAKTDPAQLAEIADARAEEIAQLRTLLSGDEAFVMAIQGWYGISTQQARMLGVLLRCNQVTYDRARVAVGDVSNDHLKVLVCVLRKVLPAGAIRTITAMGWTIEPAVREKILQRLGNQGAGSWAIT